jgi:hypothetical protein
MEMHDPIIAEVRRARENFARKFDFDLDAICAELKRKEEESGATVVKLSPRIFSTTLAQNSPACPRRAGR